MRSCKNTTTPQPGKTKTADTGGVTFLVDTNNKREIPQNHLGLALTVYVTLFFADQNSGDKKT